MKLNYLSFKNINDGTEFIFYERVFFLDNNLLSKWFTKSNFYKEYYLEVPFIINEEPISKLIKVEITDNSLGEIFVYFDRENIKINVFEEIETKLRTIKSKNKNMNEKILDIFTFFDERNATLCVFSPFDESVNNFIINKKFNNIFIAIIKSNVGLKTDGKNNSLQKKNSFFEYISFIFILQCLFGFFLSFSLCIGLNCENKYQTKSFLFYFFTIIFSFLSFYNAYLSVYSKEDGINKKNKIVTLIYLFCGITLGNIFGYLFCLCSLQVEAKVYLESLTVSLPVSISIGIFSVFIPKLISLIVSKTKEN